MFIDTCLMNCSMFHEDSTKKKSKVGKIIKLNKCRRFGNDFVLLLFHFFSLVFLDKVNSWP